MANNACDYQHQITGRYVKEITKVENIKREVFPHVDGMRKCVISLDATIDGKAHSTEGEFSFGPDTTENVACGHAEQRAKENIIKRISPEILSANTNMNCVASNSHSQPQPPAVSIPNYTQHGYVLPLPPTIYIDQYPPVVYYPNTDRRRRSSVVRFEADPDVVNNNTGFQFLRNLSSKIIPW